MEEVIFKGYGIRILKRDGRFYIEYDAGHFNIDMQQAEISEDEAEKAQKSSQDAYEVIIAVQNRNK